MSNGPGARGFGVPWQPPGGLGVSWVLAGCSATPGPDAWLEKLQRGGAGTRMLSSLSQVISVVVQALIPVTPAMSMIQPANSGLFALRWLGFSKGPRSKS